MHILKKQKIFISLLLIFTSTLLFIGCSANSANKDVKKQSTDVVREYETVDDLEGKRIGAISGSVQEAFVLKKVKNPQMTYYTNASEEVLALENDKIDAFAMDGDTYLSFRQQGKTDVVRQEEYLGDTPVYFGFTRVGNGEMVRSQFNEYILELYLEGKLQEILDFWYSLPEKEPVFDFEKLPNINGELTYAAFPLDRPHIHYTAAGFSGIEMELFYGFCKEYGYALNCYVTEYASVLTGFETGKVTTTGYLAISPEIADKLFFSDPYMYAHQTMVVRNLADSGSSSGNFFQNLAKRFEQNFIRDERWKLVLRGFCVTLILSLCSAVFGTLIGSVLCYTRRRRNKVVSTISAAFIRFFQGIPIVVFLLILYFVIFADSKISGITIGVIGFSVDFGVYVAEILRSAIDSIPHGQWEAAEALGFGYSKTMFRIILPQAINHALPVYKGQFISMVKMTSVVGYIAVQDLTKVSDIIRSQTYDALMPLLLTAAVYFLLSWALAQLIGRIEIKIDPKHRKNLLKGIDTANVNGDGIFDEGFEKDGAEIFNISHLSKQYGNAHPLKDINATVHRGDVISLIGSSGTGKTTFLRMLNRLEMPTDGTIVAFGKDIPIKGKELSAYRAKVGMVFQSFNLFSHLTIVENVMLAPMELMRVSRQEAYEKSIHLLRSVGLAEKALNYPDELSGGQQQRVAIVRAMAMNPEVLLLDEPTSALDPTMVNEVLQVISYLAKLGFTMLIVTHEMKFAESVSTRVFYMDQGIVFEEGTPEQIFHTPQNPQTRAFVNHLKLYSYQIANRDFDFVNLLATVDAFGHEHLMPRTLLNHLSLCIEEFATQALRNSKEQNFPADIVVEYAPNSDSCCLSIFYVGEKYNLFDSLDDIGIKLVNGFTSLSEYEYIQSESKNVLTLVCL